MTQTRQKANLELEWAGRNFLSNGPKSRFGALRTPKATLFQQPAEELQERKLLQLGPAHSPTEPPAQEARMTQASWQVQRRTRGRQALLLRVLPDANLFPELLAQRPLSNRRGST